MIDAGLVDELVIYMAPNLLCYESLPLFKLKKIIQLKIHWNVNTPISEKLGKILG